MARSFVKCLAALLALHGSCPASPADAARIRKAWELKLETWTLEAKTAATAEERAKVAAKRPDMAASTREMWGAISGSLDQEWAIDPAAWFLRSTPGLVVRKDDGSTAPAFASETDTLLKAVESHHLKSVKLAPLCMALVTIQDPRSLALLERIVGENPEPKVQGVAALAASMVLKTLGDDGEIMRRRLTHLRKAIIQSSDVDLGGVSVAKLAEDELYQIRFLAKGRTAPDLTGLDSGGRPLKLADHRGQVVMLVFWNSSMHEADRTLELTRETARKFTGKRFAVVGVNHDPLDRLRTLEGDGSAPWKNFSDPSLKLAGEYRVGAWPTVYVLDGSRRIHYAGAPGSFAELTVEALLAEAPAATE
jgi:peroxiredoxin